ARAHPGILVFGGSAGAHRLNQATLDALTLLGPLARELDVTHQTGSADLDGVRTAYERLGLGVRVEPFITDMGAAYAAADGGGARRRHVSARKKMRRGCSGYLKSGRAFCNSVGAWSGSGVGLASGADGSGCPARGMPR